MGPKNAWPGPGPAGESESLLSSDLCLANLPLPLGVSKPNALFGSDGMNEGGPVGVPPSDRARENIDEIVDEGAGLDARPTGVVDLLFPRVGATSCSIFLMIGSSERSVERCIQVPVLISSSCFFRQRMQTQMTWNVKKKLII